jgi:hypothetical protein
MRVLEDNMNYWDEYDIEQKVTTILRDVQEDALQHAFGCPYLTAYQLAIAFARHFPDAFRALGMPIGGRGTGQHNSLAQYLAGQLSQRIGSGRITHIEGAFLSRHDLRDMTFTGGVASSLIGTAFDLSMFRLREDGKNA